MPSISALFVSAEVAPFSKVGGLGDVAGSLPQALSRLGVRMTVISPFYRQVKRVLPIVPGEVYSGRLSFGGESVTYKALKVDHDGVTYLFVDYPPFFQREGIYTQANGEGYVDNGRRFLFFQVVVLDLIQKDILSPDVIHVNDHHTALLPYALDQNGIFRPSLLTLHNVSYQGHLPPEDVLYLPEPLSTAVQSKASPGEWINPLKIGIETAYRINTVSPTYAQELLADPELSGELMNTLVSRKSDFSGILNGIDTDYWNPATDPFITVPYDRDSLEKRALNRKALLNRCGLSIPESHPVFGSVSRLVESKGFDLILSSLSGLVASGAGLVFLGNGEERYRHALRRAAESHPHQVFYSSEFDEPLAHQIEAGVDIFLMPSKFEPCGLNQMYSLRYGALPVVHATGGLADSVIPWNQPEGCGFVFSPYNENSFYDALRQAMNLFGQPDRWRELQRNGMARDFSWERSARDYKNLYIELLKRGRHDEKT